MPRISCAAWMPDTEVVAIDEVQFFDDAIAESAIIWPTAACA